MTFQTALNSLYEKYGKYGFAKEILSEQLRSGVIHGFSVNAVYNGLRMVLALETGEHEYFSLEDVQEITHESRDELIKKVEQYRKELIAAGENPDDYFQKVEPMTFYFPHGIHLQ